MENPAFTGEVCVGHPVSVMTGVVYTAWHDFTFPGPWEIIWSRFYSTSNLTLSALGRGWQSPYFMYLRERPPLTVLVHDDGEAGFLPDPVTQDMVNCPHRMQLFKEKNRYRVWAWKEGVNYYFEQADLTQPVWRLVEFVRRTGERSSLEYDAAGRLVAIDQLPLRRIQITYNSSGLIERVELVDPKSRQPVVLVSYAYDPRSRLIAVTDGSGAAIRYGYDDADRLISETNRLGATFHFEYDDQGRCFHTFGDGGFSERFLTFEKNARRTRVRDGQGSEWIYDANDRGLIIREQDPLGAVWKHTFDPADRLAISESPLGHFLLLTYNDVGHLTKIQDGMGRTSEFEYGPLQLPIKMIHADGTFETWEYDTKGNLTARTDEAGSRTVYERDAQGRLSAAITPRGHRTDLSYAPDGRSHELRDSFGFLRFEYDVRGELIRKSDSRGVIAAYAYDNRGNLTTLTNADGSVFRFAYDVNGHITSDTDEVGNATHYRYDRFGTMVERINPDGSAVRMSHDKEGRMTAIENENGDRCTFRLNLLGTVVEQTFFDGRTETYTFDSCGQLVTIRKPDGTDIRYKYDAVGRTLEIVSGKQVLARFEYDSRERITVADSPASKVEFAYNAVGAVVSESQCGHVVKNEYDAEGNCLSQQYVSGPGGNVRFEYDLRRRLIGMRHDNDSLQEMTYDGADQLLRRIFAGRSEETRAYDSRGRMTEQVVKSANGTTLARREYGYDAADNLLGRMDLRSGRVQFRYDARSRLIERTPPVGPQETISYDSCGNLRSFKGAPFTSLGNRLLSGQTRRYVYDANGLTTEIQESTGNTVLGYDPLERLAKVVTPAGLTIAYGYDAFTRRVFKKSTEGETEFVWAGHQMRAEKRADGSVIEYLNIRYNPLAQWSNGTWYAVIADQNLVPREILGPQGSITWRVDYDAFGAVTAETGSIVSSPFRSPGQYADSETGFYQNRFRYYDPQTARLIQPDPIGIFGGLNEYVYCANNPVNFRDPLGLTCGFAHFRIVFNPKVGSKADYIAKRDSFNQARQNPKAIIPTKANYDANIRPKANQEAAAARAGGGFTSSQDADHPGDVRATGLLGQTLQPLDSGVNRSVGSQVGHQVRSNPGPGGFPAGQRTPMMDLVDQNGKPIP
ncbi:MAG: RHS repeat-associated core domain-containing protein [Planctomycetota bacterium]